MVVIVQGTLLPFFLCTLGLWSQGLKERAYQYPPGPTPSLELVSSGVKAKGKEKTFRETRKKMNCGKKKKKGEYVKTKKRLRPNKVL